MTTSIKTLRPQSSLAVYEDPESGQTLSSVNESFDFKFLRVMFQLLAAAALVGLSLSARPQSTLESGSSSSKNVSSTSEATQLSYVRPTQKTMANNYFFDAYGPYSIAGTSLVAAFGQESNAPPEWKQGTEGYARRFGSDFAIAAIGTTTRYGLSEAFKEDALYYRCECSGFLPRLIHATFSTLSARRGDDGHRVFSIPALVAPYAGSMTAVYGWYPDRYGAKDAFRLGNYSLLLYAAGNISLEFFYSGPHSLLSRMHLNNAHGSSIEGPNK